jgi:hypothetical protein
MTPARKALVPKFVLITLLTGVLSGMEYALFPPTDNTFKHSIIAVVLISAAGYFLFFRNAVKDADFKGDGKYYFLHVYFGTCCLTSLFCVSTVHYASDVLTRFLTFLIFTGIFIALYGLAIFISWRMMKTGDEEWNLGDADD